MHRYIDRFETQRDYFEDVFRKVDSTRDSYMISDLGEDFPIMAARRIHSPGNPTVFISGGVHGDEPAGVMAALQFLDELDQHRNFNFIIIPCINPVGYAKNIREGSEFQDINREWFYETDSPENLAVMKFLSENSVYNYALTMDLHETRSQEKLTSAYPPNERHPLGFHMWEVCPNEDVRVGKDIIKAVKKVTDVCNWSHVWGDTNTDGVIYYPEGAVGEMYGEAHTFENFLGKNYTQHSITTETYSGNFKVLNGESLETRVLTQLTAIRAALKALEQDG